MVSFHIFIWYASVEWISSYPLKMKRKLARCWSKSSKHTLYVTVIHCWTSRGFLTSFPFWAMTTQSWSCLSKWNSSYCLQGLKQSREGLPITFSPTSAKRYARSILQILPIGNQIFFRIAFAHEMIALEEMNEISR